MDPQLFQTLSGIVFVVFVLVLFAGLAMTLGADSRHGFGEDIASARRGDWT